MAEKWRKAARGERSGGSPADITADVIIEDAGSTYNTYEFDARRRLVRLAGTVLQRKGSSLERGVVVDTMGADGGPLPAVVIVSIPTFPGCLLRARVIGALALPDEKVWVVGVPEVDASKGHVTSLDDLAEGERAAVVRLAGCDERGLAPLSAEEAGRAIRQAREAFWKRRAQANGAARHGAAWKATAPGRVGERGEAEPHTWAEYLVPSLPARFQRYVEQMLLPDERILFFAERPEFAPSGRFALLRSQKLRHGLLLITDRQVMTMLDSLPPDSTLVDWGYVAKATAVERISATWIERREGSTEVNFVARARTGEERFALAFPGDCEDVLRGAVELVQGFIEPEGRAPARVYAADGGFPGEKVSPEELGRKYPHLSDLTDGIPRGALLAAAASRGPEGHGLGPALAVTAADLIVFEGSRTRRRPVEAMRTLISDVSSVEIVESVIKCRFDIFVPRDEEVERITLRYDYPDAPAFLRAFTVVRHLLGRPVSQAPHES